MEKQIKRLFELWDSTNSKTIGVSDLIHGLIAIGLGGTPEFTREVIYRAFKKNNKSSHVTFEDIQRLFLGEATLEKRVELLDQYTHRMINEGKKCDKSPTFSMRRSIIFVNKVFIKVANK